MMKTINIVVDFDDTKDGDEERNNFLVEIENSIVQKRSKKNIRIETHDCYHDEGKSCKNLRVVQNDFSNEIEA